MCTFQLHACIFCTVRTHGFAGVHEWMTSFPQEWTDPFPVFFFFPEKQVKQVKCLFHFFKKNTFLHFSLDWFSFLIASYILIALLLPSYSYHPLRYVFFLSFYMTLFNQTLLKYKPYCFLQISLFIYFFFFCSCSRGISHHPWDLSLQFFP